MVETHELREFYKVDGQVFSDPDAVKSEALTERC